MTRHLGGAALLLLGLLTLVGAVGPLAPPVVVVYPLTVGGGTEPEAGANVAVLLATRIAQHGGITVKPAPPGTQRKDFLTAAIALGADYYVTGYMTSIGDEVSLITQVVSTTSGTVVYSNSALVRTYSDAAGQGEPLATAIVGHAGRALASLDNPQPAASETPKPQNVRAGEADISDALRNRSHRGKATPKPATSGSPAAVRANPSAGTPAVRPTSAAVQPAPPPPLRGARALVLQVGGDGGATLAAHARDDLVTTARRDGIAADSLGASAADAIAHAKDLCAANAGAQALYAAALSLLRNNAGQPTGAEIDLVVYDCSGNVVAREHAAANTSGRSGIGGAIDRAVAGALNPLRAGSKH